MRGLDLVELFDFIDETQADEWEQLRKLHGGNEEDARTKFADRLAREIDSRGTVDVLRHGVVDLGVHIRLSFFKPAHGLTPLLGERYAANRLGLTRQLHYSPRSERSLDVTLSLNGIPVATAELKNPLTGQTVDDARRQYERDRDPRELIFEFKRRTLVHFAVARAIR